MRTLINITISTTIITWLISLVQAETGSGKTLTYLIPIVQDLVSGRLNRTAGTSGMFQWGTVVTIVLA